jgi:translation initiation factor IF-3
MIRISPVRVVDENGTQLGVMPTAQALSTAQERGYDLVEVAPMASPPVVRFLDFGQYKYELAKREKEAKRRSRAVEFKEVRLRPKIGGGDFETKVHRAIEFLGDGDRIKVTVQFRGRELTHPEIGRNLLNRFAEAIKDHGAVDRAPTLEGRSMSMTVTSSHKPKTHEGGRPARADEAESTGTVTTAPNGAEAPAGVEAPANANGTQEQPAATPARRAAAPTRAAQTPEAAAAGE